MRNLITLIAIGGVRMFDADLPMLAPQTLDRSFAVVPPQALGIRVSWPAFSCSVICATRRSIKAGTGSCAAAWNRASPSRSCCSSWPA